MNEICLVVIYNHNFERNIEVVKRIYAGRFSHVYQIMPFYRGSDPSVIGVYECSYQFNGYIAQAASRIRDAKYSHYVFVADDMVINPAINENNICEWLKLKDNSGFIRGLEPLTNTWAAHWIWGICSILGIQCRSNACEWWPLLPPRDEARTCFSRHGVDWGRGYTLDFVHGLPSCLSVNARNPYVPMKDPDRIAALLESCGGVANAECGYPLAYGYSDFFAVPQSAFDSFVQYCGIFAAMRVFVEVAIPTSLILSCPSIVRLRDTGRLAETGVTDATRIRAELESKYDLSFARLLREYPKDHLFIHPIKLSRWKDLP